MTPTLQSRATAMNAVTPIHASLTGLDGFRVEIDPARERADIILDRPPMNTVAMAEMDKGRMIR